VGVAEHRARAAAGVRCAVITVSDTRTLETDESGKEMVRLLEARGHRAVSRDVVPDEPAQIALALRGRLADPGVDAVLLNGGTGIAARDGTVEVVRAFIDRELQGFGELFRQLSYGQVRAAAMLSRAVGGIAAGKPVFSLPGSRPAVVLGMEELILPELGHLIAEIRK
jgi:molybdopterin adenylyltransferase